MTDPKEMTTRRDRHWRTLLRCMPIKIASQWVLASVRKLKPSRRWRRTKRPTTADDLD